MQKYKVSFESSTEYSTFALHRLKMGNSLLKEKTAKGLFWGGLSSTLQQLLGLVIGIVLARILSPGDYGMVAMLMVFSLIAACLQEGGFGAALAIRKKVTAADYNAVFWFSILISGVMYLILFFAAPLIAEFNKTPELTPLARYAFLGFVISSFGTAHFAYLFRNMMVKQRTIASFTGSILSGIIGILLALNGYAYWGLITQDLCYKFITMSFFWYFSKWRPSFRVDLRPIREMFGFSSKMLLTNVLNNVNNQLLQSVLGHFYPVKLVGYYSQANKWNTMGYSMVGGMVNSIAQPVLAGVSEEKDRQRRVFRKMLRFTAFLSFPAMLGLALIAPEFIVLAIKEKWVACVPYLQLLCIAGAFIPLSQLYSNLLVSRGKSTIYLISTAAMIVLQLIAVIVFHSSGIQSLLYAIVLFNIGWLFVWHRLASREINLCLGDIIRDLFPFITVALLSVGVAYGFSMLTDILWVRLLVKILVVLVTYPVLLYLLGAVVLRECLEFLFAKLKKKK